MTENLELRENYDIVIVVRAKTDSDILPENISGFMIIEHGECYSSENSDIPVLNLICTQARRGEPIGRILLYLYVYTLKYGYFSYPRGLLELANNYNNVGGLCLYNKFGFREDISLKQKRLAENEGKEYYEEGEEVCFPDNDTLPMYIDMSDPAVERRNLNNALLDNVNVPVTFDISEPLCAKGSTIGPGGKDQPLAIAQRNENQQNIIKIQNQNPEKRNENLQRNMIEPGGNVIKKLANKSKSGQPIEIDPDDEDEDDDDYSMNTDDYESDSEMSVGLGGRKKTRKNNKAKKQKKSMKKKRKSRKQKKSGKTKKSKKSRKTRKNKTKKKKQLKGGRRKYKKGGNIDADPSKIAEYITRSATWYGENKQPNEEKAIAIIELPDFNPNQKSSNGIPLIKLAMISKNMKILKMLIENPKTNIEDKKYILRQAISANDDYIINMFKINNKLPDEYKEFKKLV